MLVSNIDLYRDQYDQVYKMALRKRMCYIENQKRIESLSPVSFQSEWMTLSVDFGRQTGKTQFIIDKLLENPKAIAIVMKDMWVKEYIKIEPRIKGQVFSASGFINKFYGRGMAEHVVLGRNIPSYEIVFLDEPRFFCTQGQKNYTHRDYCSYPDGFDRLSLEELILYASYKTGAVNLMVGMR